ncbi:hypothetical protein FRC03_012717 [Tulasnella sp. 419]|nr:hypothetical protein FRC02_002097 [Tulasnella sp. 418]KAG8965982.1 hypothetical protein FRC03_012717 [Tulasnella sp. 419]
MASSPTPQTHVPSIMDENPYAGHPELSSLEAEVLWEYAKMAAMVKQLAATTRNLAADPCNDLLTKLRIVENQMGLVLTLFKASVWSTIVTAEAEGEQVDPERHIPPSRRQSNYQPQYEEDENEEDRTVTHYGNRGGDEEDSYYTEVPTPQPRRR